MRFVRHFVNVAYGNNKCTLIPKGNMIPIKSLIAPKVREKCLCVRESVPRIAMDGRVFMRGSFIHVPKRTRQTTDHVIRMLRKCIVIYRRDWRNARATLAERQPVTRYAPHQVCRVPVNSPYTLFTTSCCQHFTSQNVSIT